MLKYLILFILKRLIKILNFNKRFVTKFSPFNFLFHRVLNFFLFIRSFFNIFKKYAIFKYLGTILKILSFSSLLINFILFLLINELKIIGWTLNYSSFDNNYLGWLPDSIKEWFINLWNWFTFHLKIIWTWFIDYLAYILDKILRIIKPKPEPEPDLLDPAKGKYGDVYNKEYLNYLTETIDEYRMYLYIAIGIAAVALISIKIWKAYKGSGDGGGGGAEEVSLESLITSEASTGRNVGDYPEGYLQYFSRKMGNMVEQVKTRAGELFSASKEAVQSSNPSMAKGLFYEGDEVKWGGLPVPRVENVNGIEYYISLDKDNFINIMDSTYANDAVRIINPLSNTCVGSSPIPMGNKSHLIRDFFKSPFFVTTNSELEKIQNSNVLVGYPSASSTSVDEKTLPGYQNSSSIQIPKGKERAFDSFDDIPLGPDTLKPDWPNPLPPKPKAPHPTDWIDGSKTPTKSDYTNSSITDMFEEFT